MAHEYSVEIHNYLAAEIKSAEAKKKGAEDENDSMAQRFLEGQLSELFKIREYLNERIDLETQDYY